MLYSEKELTKQLAAGCGVFYFYAADEALVHAAAEKTLKTLSAENSEITVLDGPTPTVEEIVLAAGTISFFGGRRLVQMPLVRPSTYTDADFEEFCATLADTENAIFVLTSVVEERYGKLTLNKKERTLIAACEKLGYCVQLAKPGKSTLQTMARSWAKESGAAFEPGAEGALLDRCGDDQFLLRQEVEKLAALANYGTITKEHVQALATMTLDADTFDMVSMVTTGRTGPAVAKLKTLLALQNAPLMITGALISNYLDVYRMAIARRSHHTTAEAAKDFGYTGKWGWRLDKAAAAGARLSAAQLDQSLMVLQKLDRDLKGSKVEDDILMEAALCELGVIGGRR